MNLLVISERFWPEGSGGTLATYLITKLLVTCGFRVTVITGTRNPAKIGSVEFVVDEAFRIPNKPARWLYFLVPSVRKRYKDLMRRFDIVYIPFGYPLIPLAKELDKKVIVHLHDYQLVAYNSTILHDQQRGLVSDIRAEFTFEILEHSSIKRAMAGSLLTPLLTRLCRSWVREADTIICVSRRQAKIVSDRVSELAHKIRVMYNPLPEIPSPKEKFRNPTFTYAGGESYVKGFHIFMRTALSTLKREKSVNFFLSGGVLKREREVLVRRLNDTFRDTFRVFGRLPYEDILELYSKSHAVLVPSVCEEPLPYVVFEAMLTRTLPIASRVGGIPEIVEGTYAERLMFTPGSPDEMADRMEVVLSLSRDQLVDIGSKLQEVTLKRFSNDVTKRRLLEVFSV
uniref:Glycosyltransferase n=1 Tax=Fervidicoccus fontis TaxID=683846 RepID=A0A7J3SMQ6_9CREN